MEPVLFQSLPQWFNFAAISVLLQIGIILFVTGKRYLKWVSVGAVALVGAVVGEEAAASSIPGAAWVLVTAGLLGGALLGIVLRPVGVGLVLAYLGYVMSTTLAGLPFLQFFVAVDLFAYGLLLTDLAPTLVSGLLASAVLLQSLLWAGAPAPAAFVLASGGGSARFMASLLPSRLSARAHAPGMPRAA